MNKEALKSLINQMYDNLLNNIDEEKDTTKEQVIHYLQDAIKTIELIDEDNLGSLEHAKQSFSNVYKSIAEEGIQAYKASNDKFSSLTKTQQQNIQEVQNEYDCIDIDKISEKFEEIHNHMEEEVKRANRVITSLQDKIKTLEENSTLDALTKVFNRRSLDKYLHNVCKKGSLQHDMHLLMIDIDDFKIINDTYGHVAGDKILIFIANLLRKTLRDGDKIFRYGGEEFVIVLNRISDDACQQIAQRILKLVSTNNLIYKGTTLHVTISMGATVYQEEDTPESLIERADRALYKSKKGGKNQINVEKRV